MLQINLLLLLLTFVATVLNYIEKQSVQPTNVVQQIEVSGITQVKSIKLFCEFFSDFKDFIKHTEISFTGLVDRQTK